MLQLQGIQQNRLPGRIGRVDRLLPLQTKQYVKVYNILVYLRGHLRYDDFSHMANARYSCTVTLQTSDNWKTFKSCACMTTPQLANAWSIVIIEVYCTQIFWDSLCRHSNLKGKPVTLLANYRPTINLTQLAPFSFFQAKNQLLQIPKYSQLYREILLYNVMNYIRARQCYPINNLNHVASYS